MKSISVAIYFPSGLPLSLKNYVRNLSSELSKRKVKLLPFSNLEELKSLIEVTDLTWFPTCAGGSAPSLNYLKLLKSLSQDNLKKLVITLHGVAPFSLPSHVYYPSPIEAVKGKLLKIFNFMKWRLYRSIASKIITPSNYAREEIVSHLKLPRERIEVIYHGVNLKVFKLTNKRDRNSSLSYFLHISQWQPKKNVERIISAYNLLSPPKPKLKLVVPGFRKEVKGEGIEVIREPISHSEAAELYRNAFAFVFPSLHETFGMPILEAMACGCPVITSDRTACPEVAGNSALLVNPYSIEEIAQAMRKLIEDPRLREELVEKGLERAKQFSWERSARKHLKVFKEVLERR